MSQSKGKNRINFYVLLVISLALAFYFPTIRFGGLQAVSASFVSNPPVFYRYIGEILGSWLWFFWIPLLIALIIASIRRKSSRKKEKSSQKKELNLSYIIVWILFVFFAISSFANLIQ